MYGKWEYPRLWSTVDVDPGARIRFYRIIVVLEWGLVILALLTLGVQGQPIASFGLTSASFSTKAPAMLRIVLNGVLVGAAIGMVGTVVMGFVFPRTRAQMQEQFKPVRAMLPSTGGSGALVSIAAGVCAEILFRGFLFAYWAGIAPGLSTPVLLIITFLIFGLAHLCQGWWGIISAGLLGAFYIMTGSLALPILLHALIDIRVLALPLNPGQST